MEPNLNIMDTEKEKNEKKFLESYRADKYERPSVATDIVVFTTSNVVEEYNEIKVRKKLKLMLICRSKYPFKGQWALPGGFVEPDETTEQAASRELKEETGVEEVYREQLYTFSDPGRDPRTWVMSCSYLALVESSKLKLEAGDDAEAAAWFDVSLIVLKEEKRINENSIVHIREFELLLSFDDTNIRAIVEMKKTIDRVHSNTEFIIKSNDGLAFDHAKIITVALMRLRGKIPFTSIILHLLPDSFTLVELQRTYESIMDTEVDLFDLISKAGHMIEEVENPKNNSRTHQERLYKRKWSGLV